MWRPVNKAGSTMSRQFRLASGRTSARLECIVRHVSNLSAAETGGKAKIALVQPTVTHDPKALKQGSAFPPTTPGVLRLYNMRFCPFAQRTKLVLEYKKIPHETVNVDLKYKPDWFLQLSPLGLVPVLQLDQLVLPESTATCDWLDDTFPGEARLTPQDDFRRAWDRVIMENVGKISNVFYEVRRKPELKDRKLASLEKRIKWFEDRLAERTGPYFGGERPAMVDFIIWPHFERLPALSMLVSDPRVAPDPQRMPRLAAWVKEMTSLPAVKATIMDDNSHAHFFASFGTGYPDYDYGLNA